MSNSDLTHIDASGNAHMVDVADREVTTRTATTVGRVLLSQQVVALLRDGAVPKGDVLATARIAGIMATKRTPDLIPLCHPIAVHGVSVELVVVDDGVEITATVKTADRTGVEMEALTAVAVAGLTVIDMVKALDPGATITDVKMTHKDGGRNGEWTRS
jgi:cyclic pyranopterin phosphate synthase